MSRRFYFTNENGDNIGNDHIGNIRGAKTVAKRLANELNCEVCINDCETEDMIDFVYPDKTETVESVEVAEETTVPEIETAEQKTELNTEVETEQTENNVESVSETHDSKDAKADTSKTDELSGTTKMLMVFSPVVSEYLRQIEYIDTS